MALCRWQTIEGVSTSDNQPEKTVWKKRWKGKREGFRSLERDTANLGGGNGGGGTIETNESI